ncbi:MAG: hypothetical protein ACXVSA_20030 [Solirubrobacteraceae bacterium]
MTAAVGELPTAIGRPTRLLAVSIGLTRSVAPSITSAVAPLLEGLTAAFGMLWLLSNHQMPQPFIGSAMTTAGPAARAGPAVVVGVIG